MAKRSIKAKTSTKLTITDIFLPYEIKVAKAHTRGLHKIGLINKAEISKLFKCLTAIEKDFKKGKMRTTSTDCYAIIKKYLCKKAGAASKKFSLHGSKLDQTQTASRLFIKDALSFIRKKARKLAGISLATAEQNQDTKTAHYLCALTESLITDIEFLDKIKNQIDYCPLGALKGQGTSAILERDFTAKELEFTHTQINSFFCIQNNAKFENMYYAGLRQILLTLKTREHKELNTKETRKALVENTDNVMGKLYDAEKFIKKIRKAKYEESEKSLISLGAPGNLDIHYYKTKLKKL